MLAFVVELIWTAPVIMVVAIAVATAKTHRVPPVMLVPGGALLGVLYALLLAGVFGPAVTAVSIPVLPMMIFAGATSAAIVVSMRSHTLTKSSAATYFLVLAFSGALYFYAGHVLSQKSAVRLIVLQSSGAGKELEWAATDTQLSDTEKQLMRSVVPDHPGTLPPVRTVEIGAHARRTVIVVIERGLLAQTQFRLPDAGTAVIAQDLSGGWRFASDHAKLGKATVTVSPGSKQNDIMIEVDTLFDNVGAEVGLDEGHVSGAGSGATEKAKE